MKGKKTLQRKGVPRAEPLLTAKRKQPDRPLKQEVARRATLLNGGADGVEESKPLHTFAQIERNNMQVLPQPTFVPCTLTGPDGSTRSGWEMWLGDHCFGRSDSKNLLLASYSRLQNPPSSFHWRAIRRQHRSLPEKKEKIEESEEGGEGGEGEKLARSEELF